MGYLVPCRQKCLNESLRCTANILATAGRLSSRRFFSAVWKSLYKQGELIKEKIRYKDLKCTPLKGCLLKKRRGKRAIANWNWANLVF